MTCWHGYAVINLPEGSCRQRISQRIPGRGGNLLGAPKDFRITIRDMKISAGAGFIVAYAGDIMTMPGLPKVPAAEKIDVDETGKITGLF